MSEAGEHFSQTCRKEISEFVKCTRENLRRPSDGKGMFTTMLPHIDGTERDDISDCIGFAQHYADCIRSNKLLPKGEKLGAEQKLAPPPLCEMETAVYGQCMANLLDNEVRRRRREDGGDVSEITLDPSKCKFTISAFDKCVKAHPDGTIDPFTTATQSPTYYWMSSIYWQAPSKKQ